MQRSYQLLKSCCELHIKIAANEFSRLLCAVPQAHKPCVPVHEEELELGLSCKALGSGIGVFLCGFYAWHVYSHHFRRGCL